MTLRHRLRVYPLSTGPSELSPEEAHYARRVLRLRDGDPVALFDGDGTLGEGTLRPHGVEVDHTARLERPPVRVTLGVAPPKGERADWLVEKVAELGASRLIWLVTERSVTELSEVRLDRLRRVAEAAARQSNQAFLTRLEGQIRLADFLKQDFDRRFVADPGVQNTLLSDSVRQLGEVAVLIGPEGGFTPDELSAAIKAGYSRVSLGHSVLRIETAAMIATAFVIQSAEGL